MSNVLNRIFAVPGRIIVGLLLGVLVLAAGATVINLLEVSPESSTAMPWLAPFYMHSTMLALSLLLMLILSKGRIPPLGLRSIPVGSLFPIVVWSFAVGTIGAIILGLFPSQESLEMGDFTSLQIVIFIWFYASIGEEFLCRGLIQGFLAPLIDYRIGISRFKLTLPVIVGALFFSLIHIMPLAGTYGTYKLLFFLLLAGILGAMAGYYREKTGSLIPAVVVHMMFNISSSLVDFLGKRSL